MPETNTDIYWDANTFLSYINEHPERLLTLETLLDTSADGQITIYTSALSQVEVAFAASELQQRALDQEQERRIDALWSDSSTVEIVEYHDGIGGQARALMREAAVSGRSLKPLDAIHLATAQWLLIIGFPISEFHTYDRRLWRFGQSVQFNICEPYIVQPRML